MMSNEVGGRRYYGYAILYISFNNQTNEQEEGTLSQKKQERFGYDPADELKYLGVAKVLHNGQSCNFEFYYNQKTKRIDVCHFGCNGTLLSGEEISEGQTTLPDVFSRAFFELKRV